MDRQWNWRQNRALELWLKDGRLTGPACIENLPTSVGALSCVWKRRVLSLCSQEWGGFPAYAGLLCPGLVCGLAVPVRYYQNTSPFHVCRNAAAFAHGKLIALFVSDLQLIVPS